MAPRRFMESYIREGLAQDTFGSKRSNAELLDFYDAITPLGKKDWFNSAHKMLETAQHFRHMMAAKNADSYRS